MNKNYSLLFLIFLLLIFSCEYSFAQSYPTDKGSMLLGGESAFNSDGGDLFENREGDRITRLSIEFPFTYFIAEDIGIGGAFLMNSTSQGGFSSTEWGIGPQATYFFSGGKQATTAKGSTYPYLRVLFLYTNISATPDWTGTIFDFGGGIIHMLTESVGIGGSAGYQILNYKPEDGDSQSGNRIRVNAGFAIFFY